MTSNIGVRDLQRRAVGFGGAGGADARASPTSTASTSSSSAPSSATGSTRRSSSARSTRRSWRASSASSCASSAQQLAERNVTIELTDAATDYLAEKGYDPDNGARPLARVMQEEVKRPLGDELLFGALENGGHVVVDAAARARFEFDFQKAAAQRVETKPGPH